MSNEFKIGRHFPCGHTYCCFHYIIRVSLPYFMFVSSYLHCEWATEQKLEKDKRIQQKIKRFKMKQAQRALIFADVRLRLKSSWTNDCISQSVVLLDVSVCIGFEICLFDMVCMCVCDGERESFICLYCFVCVGRDICVHIFESLYFSIQSLQW